MSSTRMAVLRMVLHYVIPIKFVGINGDSLWGDFY